MNSGKQRKIMKMALWYASTTMVVWLFAGQVQAVCTAELAVASVVESTPTADFTAHGDGTVTHDLTGLMWRRCALGRSGDDCVPVTGYILMDWNSALRAAASDTTAGYNDWRLASKQELNSIFETCSDQPNINQTIFPNIPSLSVWSSTSASGDWAYAVQYYEDTLAGGLFGPLFSYHLANQFTTDTQLPALLVRGGRGYATFDALAPRFSALSVTGSRTDSEWLTATSNTAAVGYSLVVAQGSAAPTSTEVKAGTNYGAVTIVASSSGVMPAATPSSQYIAGLTANTPYDLYLVGYDDNNKALTFSPSKLSFTTDSDGDGDGVADSVDAFPADPTRAVSCAAGFHGTFSCVAASLGHYVPVAGALVETACVAGRYADVTGLDNCKPAPLGRYVPGAAATAPIACVAGTFSDVTGLDNCKPAPLGRYVPSAAAAAPIACVAGSYADVTGLANCKPAPQGSYVDTIGAVAAVSCPAGESTVSVASTSSADCLLDTDLDGSPNTVDSDDDNDSVPDAYDAYPLDASRSKVARGGGAFSPFLLLALLGSQRLFRRRRG